MEKLTKQAAEKFIDVLQQEENRCKIEANIINPIVAYIGKKLWPYIISLSLLLCFIFIILVYFIYITFHLQKNIRLQNLKQ